MADPGVAAIGRAAALLGASHNAVVAGLGTDIAGAEAAIALARRIGGAFDHAASAGALADLGVMREAGWMVTSPIEARAWADVMLLVGPGLAAACPEYAERLDLAAPPPLAPEHGRRVLRLCPDGEWLAATLGVLRATLAGRPVAAPMPGIGALAEALRAARYGVAVWSAATLDPLAIEMLCGIVDDLNATTRFAGLPLAGPGNVAGVVAAGGWCCGFPPRTGFGRGRAEHDPWRFDAGRMVASGEADALLWISSMSPTPPPFARRLPTVALVAPGTVFAVPPDVVFIVGCPGRDHDAVLHDARLGALAAFPATAASAAPSVAAVLGRIMAALPC